MIYTKKISVFYVCTERELESGELEDCLHQFMGRKPSKRYSFDLFLFFNKVSNITRLENLISQLNGNPSINAAEYINLNLSEKDDVFWYPWSKSPKPKTIPKLGYTAGANELFYQSMFKMMEMPAKYENFLMLEADTFCLEDLWFDLFLKYIKTKKFEIAGSIYKGRQKCHLESKFREHINGVALYKNSKRLKDLLLGGQKYIEENLEESGYMNFDISNFLFNKKVGKKYDLIDTELIINLSDPRDYKISKEEIKTEHKNAIVVHQKRQKINKIINPALFDNHGSLEKTPVFFCNAKGASDYVIKKLDINLREDYKDSFVKIKVLSPMGGKIIVQGFKYSSFDNYPKEFFEDKEGNVFICKIFNLKKLIADGSINVLSVIIDARYSSDFETQTFLNFHILRSEIKSDIFLYSFMSNSENFISSMFLNYEKTNFGGEIQDKNLRTQKFSEYIRSTDDFNFLIKKLIGISYPSRDQFDHLCCILSKFNFFRIECVDQVMDNVFSSYLNIEKTNRPEINFQDKTYLINTINRSTRKYNEFKHQAKFYDCIYMNFSKDFSSNKTSVNRKVPILFHIPKNAGTFLIGTMTRYFVRIFGGDKGCNVQRLSIDEEKRQGLIIFGFFYDESWKKDKKIKQNKREPAPRSRKTTLDTIVKYLNEKKMIILAVTVESSFKSNAVDQFEEVWEILKQSNSYPLNFMLVRDAWSRTQSMFHYLNSQKSNHESTNFENKFKNIEAYLSSEMLEDSWTIRQLAKIPNSQPIADDHYFKAIDWMKKNKFLCKYVKYSNEVIAHVLEECYNIKVAESDLIVEVDNINKYEKIELESIDPEIQKIFQERVKYETLFNNIVTQ